MATAEKRKVLLRKTIINWLEKRLGEKNGEEFKVYSGKEGKEYTEYSGGTWTIIFECSQMYQEMNGYSGSWKFHTEFHDFLEGYGYYMELGNAWNGSIYKI